MVVEEAPRKPVSPANSPPAGAKKREYNIDEYNVFYQLLTAGVLHKHLGERFEYFIVLDSGDIVSDCGELVYTRDGKYALKRWFDSQIIIIPVNALLRRVKTCG